MQQTKLIIFDLDGTLIDSADDLATAVNRMLARLNLPAVATDTIKSWVGNGSYKLVERSLSSITTNAADLQNAHKIFLAEYAGCATDQSRAYAGVVQGLAQLRKAGFRLAICTNKPARYLPAILTHFGWSETFDMVVGGDTLVVKKPDPAPLLHICKQLGVSPNQAVMVGDSKNDILAGRRAGMLTLGLSYGYNYGKPLTDSCPDGIFDDFSSLVGHLLAKR